MNTLKFKQLAKKYYQPGPRYNIYPAGRFWNNSVLPQTWDQEINTHLKDGGRFDLYLHLPFCESLCIFCGLNIKVTRDKKHNAPYIEAIKKEADQYKISNHHQQVHSLFIGGGTPTSFAHEQLDDLLKHVLGNSKPQSGLVELDPRTTTEDHLKVFHKYGFKNARVGIQDFNEDVLNSVNRRQTTAQVKKLNELLRQYDFNNIEFEFIYGLPNQSFESLRDTVGLLKEFDIDGVLFYPYAPVPWLTKPQRDLGQFVLPSDEDKFEFGLSIHTQLIEQGMSSLGFNHYRVNSYNDEIMRGLMGNLPKTSETIIGLGVSSISKHKNMMKQNTRIFDAYANGIKKSKTIQDRSHIMQENEIEFSLALNKTLNSNEFDFPNTDILKAYIEDEILYEKDQKLFINPEYMYFMKDIIQNLDPHH